MTLFNLNDLPYPNIVTWGLGLQHMNFRAGGWGGHNLVHSKVSFYVSTEKKGKFSFTITEIGQKNTLLSFYFPFPIDMVV